jgi:hypothetical protein
VLVHGEPAQVEVLCDLAIAEAVRHQDRNLALAGVSVDSSRRSGPGSFSST